MANVTNTDIQEYNIDLLRVTDFGLLLQGLNEMMGGYLGVILILTISIVVFGVLSLFGDGKSSLYGATFSSLLLSFICLGLQILTPTMFFIFVVINVAMIIVMTRS